MAKPKQDIPKRITEENVEVASTDEFENLDTEILEENEGAEKPKKSKRITEENVDLVISDSEFSKSINYSDRQIEQIANERERTLRESWAKEPKVPILIPFAPGEEEIKPRVKQYVNINGVALEIPKNEMHSVPKSVALLVMESLNQTNAALNQFSIADESKRNALL